MERHVLLVPMEVVRAHDHADDRRETWWRAPRRTRRIGLPVSQPTMSTGAKRMFNAHGDDLDDHRRLHDAGAAQRREHRDHEELEAEARREPSTDSRCPPARSPHPPPPGACTGPPPTYTPTSTKMPMNTDSISDWLNTRFARSCCCAPTACDTIADRADIQDLREREHDEPEVAGGRDARGLLRCRASRRTTGR